MTHRWRGHSHPELYNMIHAGLGPGASDPQTSYWQGLAGELTQVDADLNKALNDLKATWQGSASDSANAGMTPLQAWASDAQTGSNVMRISTEDQAEYIASARAEMPKPVEVTTPKPAPWEVGAAGAMAVLGNPGPAAMVALQAADHERQEAAQNAAAEKAVDTMNTYESSSTWNRNTLGTFVPPPEVVVSTPPPAGAGAPGGVVGGWMAGSGYSDRNRNQATSSSGASVPGGGGPAPAPVPNAQGQGGNTSGVGAGGNGGHYTPPPLPKGNDTGTTPEGYLPPGPTPQPMPAPNPPLPPPHNPNPLPNTGLPLPSTTSLPGGGSPPGGKPSGLPGGGGARGGVPAMGGLGGFDADGRPGSQLGKGGVVGMGIPTEGVAGRGAAAAGAGARGGAHGGMPMGMGAGAQGEDDDEHFAPDYLMETTDVFGDERIVSPAVIGGEAPADEEK